jgi:hypothetical protein
VYVFLTVDSSLTWSLVSDMVGTVVVVIHVSGLRSEPVSVFEGASYSRAIALS